MERAAALAIGAAAQVDSKPIIQAGAQVLVTSVMQQLAPLIALLVVVAFLYFYWTSTQPRTNADKKEKAEDKSMSAPESKHGADVKPTMDDKKQTESDLQ